ncbi:MAG: SGNH/GDSL hydrolase family protein [Bacilli bacterium]
MKKVFLILTLFLSCYFIYTKTEGNKKNYLVIGDSLSKGINEYGVASYGYSDFIKDYLENKKILKNYNKTYTDVNYKVSDIVKILEYNESKNNISLNRLIKEADIITISLGIDEIYYKINKNNQNIYTYIDNMISNYNKILNYISKFHHDKVYILGYYNTTKNNIDIFNYANYKLEVLTKKYNYTYIDLSKILDNNPTYISQINNNYMPNIRGYQKISQIIVENLKNN